MNIQARILVQLLYKKEDTMFLLGNILYFIKGANEAGKTFQNRG